MTFAVKIDENKTVLLDITMKNKNVAIIGTIINSNYSLIKYILALTRDCGITLNNAGYICIKRENGSTTSLQRVILEFYAQYNQKINEELKKKNIEVDHINNNKLDNRIENFQILTNSNNVLKSKGKEYQVAIDKKYILKVDKGVKELNQYKKDENNLKVSSSKFNKYLKSANNEDIGKLGYLYLYSSYSGLISFDSFNWLDYKNYENCITEKCRKKLIMLYSYKNYIYVYKIFDNNLKLLQVYRNKYKNIDLILKRYGILNNKNLNLLKNKSKYYDYNYMMNKINSDNILYDLYELILYEHKYVIKDSNILSCIDISMDLDKIGKYNCIRIMYLLGLIKRENADSKKTFMSIPIYTDEKMKEVNKNAKRILDLNWRKVRFFMVMEEFGDDKAKCVYKERYTYLKRIYNQYSLKAKNDIMDLLIKDEQIKSLGFITIDEIFEDIQYKNELRKSKGEDFNYISEKFDCFIRDLLNYNSDTKKLMEKLGIKYTTVNKNIIKNIKEYQKKNGLKAEITGNLKSNNKVIVLKELI